MNTTLNLDENIVQQLQEEANASGQDVDRLVHTMIEEELRSRRKMRERRLASESVLEMQAKYGITDLSYLSAAEVAVKDNQ